MEFYEIYYYSHYCFLALGKQAYRYYPSTYGFPAVGNKEYALLKAFFYDSWDCIMLAFDIV